MSEITKLTKFEGLDQHEVVALAALAENLEYPEDNATSFQIKRDMEASGFTKVATTLALKSLLHKELLETGSFADPSDGAAYIGYQLTDAGWTWMLENKNKFVLKRPPKGERF